MLRLRIFVWLGDADVGAVGRAKVPVWLGYPPGIPSGSNNPGGLFGAVSFLPQLVNNLLFWLVVGLVLLFVILMCCWWPWRFTVSTPPSPARNHSVASFWRNDIIHHRDTEGTEVFEIKMQDESKILSNQWLSVQLLSVLRVSVVNLLLSS